MRLIYFHNGSDLYGASRSFLRLATRLTKDGHIVKAILPYEGPLLTSLRNYGVDAEILQPFPIIERRAFKNSADIVKMMFGIPLSVVKICRLIAKFNPNILHSNTSIIIIPAIASRLMNIPHIWHIRETFSEFGLFWNIYQNFMLWGAEKIIAVSTPIADQFAEKRRKKVNILYNGFPKEEFKQIEKKRVDLFKNKYGLKDELLVGLIGRIKFLRKGQEYLVQAAFLLKEKFPNVRYLIIGSPFPGNEDHLERLLKLIKSLGLKNIIITGDVDDIKAAYSALDISVITSGLPEPFGGVVIESMAMGKPVIGTRCGGTIEQIDDGVTGILIPARDSIALSNALSMLIENDKMRESMGNAGRRRFLEKFEFESFYSKILKYYLEVSR